MPIFLLIVAGTLPVLVTTGFWFLDNKTSFKNLNNILKEEKEFEILENDIFYKEGILEFLEKNNNIDIIIIYEKLYGQINIINLIKNIKKINNKIKIFFILEKKNEEIENLLKQENIKNIFYNNEINVKDFIENIKNYKLDNDENLQEEIKILKDIINKKDEELLRYQKQQKEHYKERKRKKLVIIVGEENSGKSMIISNLVNSCKIENYYEFIEVNLKSISELEKLNSSTYKFIFICELEVQKVKMNKKILDKLILENKINFQKVNIIFNKINKYSINSKIAKNIFKNYQIIGNIKLNNYADYLINKKNNYKKENKKLKRKYIKIIKKL